MESASFKEGTTRDGSLARVTHRSEGVLSLLLPAVHDLLDILHLLFEQCGFPVNPAQGLCVCVQNLDNL